MGNLSSQFALVYRDYVTDGVPASGDHEPVKSEIRALGQLIETSLGALSLGSVSVTYATKAELDADLAHDADSVGLVYADPMDANNDLYVKTGASGAGAWTLTAILHDAVNSVAQSFVTAAETAETNAAASADRAEVAAASGWGLSEKARDVFSELAGRYGGSQTAASANVNAVCRAYDCGTDFEPGYIDGVRARVTAGAVPLVTAKIWERAPDAPDLNAIPGSTGDILVATATISGAQFDANGKYVPTPRYLAQNGYTYLAAIEAYGADGVTRIAVQYYFATVPDEAQRFEGFSRVGAASYTNFTSTRSLAVGLVTANLVDVKDAKDRLADSHLVQQAANFFNAQRSNEDGLRGECFARPIGAGVSVRFGGDSLCAQTTGAPARISSAVVAALLPNATVINVGVGGQTSAQIENTLVARSAAEWGWTNFVNASTNDEGGITYAETKAEIDSLIARFTGQWVFSPAIIAGGYMSPKQRRIFHELRAVHGARIWDWENFTFSYEGLADSVTRYDGLHLSSYGCEKMGLTQARLVRAMNGGAPYIHDEILPVRDGDAAGTQYSNGLILGTAKNTRIVAGDNSDNALQTNAATGALQRGSGALGFGARELIVRSENEYGSHDARKTFLPCRDTSDTDPRHEVEFTGSEQQCVVLPVDNNGAESIPPPTKLSIFIALRVVANPAGSFDPVSILQTADGIPRITAKYAVSGAFIGTSPTLPEPVDRYKTNSYFVSIDTQTGLMTWATNEVSSSAAIAADSATIRTAGLTKLFMSTGSYLRGVALSRYMLFTGRAFNFTNPAERAFFYDPATGLPKDIGGAATVDGTQAVIDLFGREGDWFLGHNPGSMGNLFPPPWRGVQNRAIRDLLTR